MRPRNGLSGGFGPFGFRGSGARFLVVAYAARACGGDGRPFRSTDARDNVADRAKELSMARIRALPQVHARFRALRARGGLFNSFLFLRQYPLRD
jgi:hypothetical protein